MGAPAADTLDPGKPRARRALGAAVWVAVACALFAACNAAATFLLEPYGSKSELTWHDYYEQDGMDTVIAGSSLAKAALDPSVLEDACGAAAFNLASPSQSLEESFVALRTAYDDHAVKRAVFGLSCSTLTSGDAPGPESAFLRERNKPRPLADALAVDNEMLWHYGSARSADSLNFVFPWVQNHCDLYLSAVVDNVKRKLGRIDLAQAAEELEPGWTYLGRGAGAQALSSQGADDLGAYALEGTAHVDPDRARTLSEICAYCSERGIDLVFIGTPLPRADLVGEGSTYAAVMDEAAAMVRAGGAAFYDFNRAAPTLFQGDAGYFADSTHLNVRGCEAFSRAFARFLAACDSGEDVGAYFV